MRVYSFIIALQLSLLMWVGVYHSARGLYLKLDASHASNVSFTPADMTPNDTR
ncbi:hypothetical protein FHT78_000522 [Rhizobium sp. BK196]|jgi:hypothetical protein|nr:hypothetical protein [Rhizobium sp. BK196]